MFIDLKKLVSSSLKRSGVVNQVEASMVLASFQKIVEDLLGKEHAFDVRALHVKDGVLTIACMHVVYATELSVHEMDIVGELEEKHPGMVKRMRYLV